MRGQLRGFKHTEEARAKMSASQKGHSPTHWKGGRFIDRGYVRVYVPDHPQANNNGYVLEHRLVMEEMRGRYLEPNEQVHHKGAKYPLGSKGNRSDNRYPENLRLFPTPNSHHAFESRFMERDENGRFKRKLTIIELDEIKGLEKEE